MKLALTALLAASVTIPLAAQNPTQPAALLRIFCERIKEGREKAHETVETKFAVAVRRAKFPWGVLGMDAVTGSNDVWFIQPLDSFADLQKEWDAYDKAAAMKAEMQTLEGQDGEQRVSGRTWLAQYRPAMSYRPGDFITALPKMRLVHVTVIRVKPGYDNVVHEIARLGIGALNKAGDERPLLTYQVTSGDSNTYLLFRASADWASLDKGEEQTRAIFAAMGDDVKKYVGMAREALVSEESLTFALNPNTSAVSKAFADGDPAFWNPTPAVAPKKAAAKSEKPATAK